jgi:hypothetical protein
MAHALPTALQGVVMSMDGELNLAALLDVPFDFVRLPDPLPASLRPERRVPLVLLLVAKSHGSGASWKGLQLLNWAVRDPRHAEVLLAFREQRDIPDRPVVRFEPALDRALDLAVGLGLLEQKGSRVFRLTEAGRRVIKAIEASDALTREREVLAKLTGKVTQAEVRRMLEWRDA